MAYWRFQSKTTIQATHVNSVAWQPGQGGKLALATNNGGKLVRTGLVRNDSVVFGGAMGRMDTLAWSPAGDRLATVGYHRAIIWNSKGTFNKELQVRPMPGLRSTSLVPKFSNDGSFIVVFSKNRMGPTYHGQFLKFETSTGTLQQTLRIPLSLFHYNAVWKDELEVFCQGLNKTINLWRIGLEEPLQTITHADSYIDQMTFNPKTNILAFISSFTPTVSLWKTDTPDMAVTLLTGHDAPVVRILWQSDHSAILATLDELGGVRIWDTTLRTTLHQYNVFLGARRYILASVSPDGRFLAVAGETDVNIVKFDTGDTVAVCEGGGRIGGPRWSPRGDKIAVSVNSPSFSVFMSVFNVDMINSGINLKRLSMMRVASLLEGNLVNGKVEARKFLTSKIPKDLVDDVVSYI